MFNHLDIGEEIHHIPKATLVQLRAGKIFGQYILEARIFLFNLAHSLINNYTDFRRMRRLRYARPAGRRRHEENIFVGIFIPIFLVPLSSSEKLLIFGFKAIGYVLEKNKPKHDGFVFRSIQIATQNAGGIPYLFFKTNIACTLLPHFLLHEKFLKYKVSRQKVTRQAAYQPIRSLDILINPGTAPPLISVWY